MIMIVVFHIVTASKGGLSPITSFQSMVVSQR